VRCLFRWLAQNGEYGIQGKSPESEWLGPPYGHVIDLIPIGIPAMPR